MKKVLLFVLVACMLASVLLVGCSQQAGKEEVPTNTEATNKEQEPVEEETLEPIEYTILATAPSKVIDENNRAYLRFQEEFNIKFKFDTIVGDTDTKLGVMIAGGEYPDLITATDSYSKLKENNVYQPLEGLMENYPKLKDTYFGDLWNKSFEDDGHIYVMPLYGQVGAYIMNTATQGAFWIQKAVLTELGYPEIKTIEEYFNAIAQYKEMHPDIDGIPTVGFEVLSDDWRAFCYLNMPAYLAGYPNDGGWLVDPNEPGHDKYTLSMHEDKPITLDYLKAYNDAFNKGLIDPSCFTMKYDEYLSKIASGAVLGFYDQVWQFGDAVQALVQQGKVERTYVPLSVTFSHDIPGRYQDIPERATGRGLGFTTSCQDPTRLLDALEAMQTEDWQVYLNWGVEGEDFDVVDGRYIMNEEQTTNHNNADWQAKNMGADASGTLCYAIGGDWGGVFDNGNSIDWKTQPEVFFDSLSDYEKELLDAYGKKTWYEFMPEPVANSPAYPAWNISLEEGSEGDMVIAKLMEYKREYYVKAIIGDPEDVESTYNEFLEKINKLNCQAFIDDFNEAIQWRVDNWK